MKVKPTSPKYTMEQFLSYDQAISTMWYNSEIHSYISQPTEENQCNDNMCLTQDTVCKTESESSCDN